jgi:hypothetical protein
MMFAFEHEVEIAVEPSVATRRFLDDPERWLPASGGLRGANEFDGRVRLGLVVTPTRFTVGRPWVDEGSVTRWVEASFGGPSGGPALVHVEGELRVRPGRFGGAEVRFAGAGRPPAHGVRRVLGRAVMRSVVRAVLEAVVERLSRADPSDSRGREGEWWTTSV